MKTLFTLLLSAIAFISSVAQVNPNHTTVKGYRKKNGAYVAPSHRTIPNHTKRDNYSTKGNTNPYTGKKGYVPVNKPYHKRK